MGHEILCAELHTEDGDHLASLGGIIDPGGAICRVVEAELAQEALSEERTRARNDREAQSFLAL